MADGRALRDGLAVAAVIVDGISQGDHAQHGGHGSVVVALDTGIDSGIAVSRRWPWAGLMRVTLAPAMAA